MYEFAFWQEQLQFPEVYLKCPLAELRSLNIPESIFGFQAQSGKLQSKSQEAGFTFESSLCEKANVWRLICAVL